MGETLPSSPVPAALQPPMPPPIDEDLENYLGSCLETGDLPASARPRTYLRVSDGGLGMRSITSAAPADNAASWHKCLPHILRSFDIPTVGALMTASPWCAQALPKATEQIRAASGDPSLLVGDAEISASQRMLLRPLLLRQRSTSAPPQPSSEPAPPPRSGVRADQDPRDGCSRQPPHPTTSQPLVSGSLFWTGLGLDIPSQVGTCQHRRPDGTLCGALLTKKR